MDGCRPAPWNSAVRRPPAARFLRRNKPNSASTTLMSGDSPSGWHRLAASTGFGTNGFGNFGRVAEGADRGPYPRHEPVGRSRAGVPQQSQARRTPNGMASSRKDAKTTSRSPSSTSASTTTRPTTSSSISASGWASQTIRTICLPAWAADTASKDRPKNNFPVTCQGCHGRLVRPCRTARGGPAAPATRPGGEIGKSFFGRT